MNLQAHEELKGKLWEIANRLRGPYRPPQYRLVMLPMVVLRRLDCVLAPTRDAVLARRDALAAQRLPVAAQDRLLGKAADPNRKHPLYNVSRYTSQIIPYQDSELERLYAFVRNLLAKLPPPGGGKAFVLDDEVALRFFRLQQMTAGSIDLAAGDAYPLKGPTDLGTGAVREDAVVLSSLIERLNERFGTDFTEADQLFFDQIRAAAEHDETIAEAARANNFANFAAYLDRMLDELFIARMEGNEAIFSRVMTDSGFRAAAHEHLAREIFRRVRESGQAQ